MKDAISPLKLQEVNPGGQPARLSVVQPSAGIDRNDRVLVVKMFGIGDGRCCRLSHFYATNTKTSDGYSS
jgi:hypothetical protein